MLQSSSSEKRFEKPLKNCFFVPNLHRKGVNMGHVQGEKTFFGRNNKSRSSAFGKFLSYQNILCFDWVMNPFLSWVMFSVKKVSFPAKTAVNYIYETCIYLLIWFLKLILQVNSSILVKKIKQKQTIKIKIELPTQF